MLQSKNGELCAIPSNDGEKLRNNPNDCGNYGEKDVVKILQFVDTISQIVKFAMTAKLIISNRHHATFTISPALNIACDFTANLVPII